MVDGQSPEAGTGASTKHQRKGVVLEKETEEQGGKRSALGQGFVL